MVATIDSLCSVIIPAHNEGAVISRCVTTLLHEAEPGEFEIHVVSNGSSDDTVERTRRALGDTPAASVHDTEVASKIAALRIGDAAASTYPRIYLDADVVLTTRDARALVAALLDAPGPAVAAPVLRVDASRSSWAVRAYHAVWVRMPYVADGVIGSGVYAVNARGGRRIGSFPDVVNDDAYVRGLFGTDERITSTGEFVSTAPTTVIALVRRRARTELGNREVETFIGGAGRSSTVSALLAVARSEGVSTVDIGIYVAITVAAKALAKYRTVRGTQSLWSMDTTSRETV
ncbi:glycosyltransferase family 2 protein [Rhodococcus sp. BP-349]|uniref:glycosyltransferase n=1 Tax=unclassified Rhodococcus (in: high G+C Gram-positive bacteria) TaxID=192944 RepID=UPI001C9B3337|nr:MULTISPECIES: glycosyltransferase [unclassified Rhodococcus (in: high G+C Gram-positive bacteria)]MBY6539467.1 glycosyltransferase family 2 protein [Rhodococcus sp. BP-363]MBY6544205.1 glycosyltransferase family 2 protein [Rhodococcus sp. BP-369]MBY6563435.1 glycosyltransferase family 2 protein [Rhodococcus sp. BP-370]MBY6577727.1 glycosyltransferase family 2 protein [Rhodococcus sp. BP-364]MBY6587028.1 glycosyltransferase family 2 protein [Rhodococcus sp. BP-358]